MKRPRTSVLLGFVIVSFLLRLVPWALNQFQIMSVDPETTIYPWNFSPFYAVCLFGAAFMTNRHNVFLLMLGSIFVGDVAIGLLYGNMEFAFYPSQMFVYLGYIALISIGFFLRNRRSWSAIFGAGLAGACAFFVISNFGSWKMGTTYPQTWDGLMTCYVAGIPFFRNSLVSMAIFLPVLFSGFAVKSEVVEPVAGLAAQSG